jgi:hypothetical protein
MAKVALKPLPTQPDFANCRARLSGFGGYVDCLSDEAYYCIHALKFGDCYLCFHPERDQTVARTETLRLQQIEATKRGDRQF